MEKLRILYCKTGWMKRYQGYSKDDYPIGGGIYNDNHIGQEIYNFLDCDGYCYGFVQTQYKNHIHLDKITGNKKDINKEYVDNVLVIWSATNPQIGGQYIVGYYENARVYSNTQTLSNDKARKRKSIGNDKYIQYIISCKSKNAHLIEVENRVLELNKPFFGRTNYKFGVKDIDNDVTNYIRNDEIKKIEHAPLEGKEKETIAKYRCNQNIFRDNLLVRYNSKCCLCGISNNDLLIASHIKPWSECNNKEKLDTNNGILLCAMHDKLFDKGLISFDDNGKVLISSKLCGDDISKCNINQNINIEVNEGNEEFLEFHRRIVLKK